MFADLMDKEIQPKAIDVRHLPEIQVPYMNLLWINSMYMFGEKVQVQLGVISNTEYTKKVTQPQIGQITEGIGLRIKPDIMPNMVKTVV